MNIKLQNGILTLEEIDEMSAANARQLREEMRAAYSPGVTHVDIDMTDVRFVDGCGLGALAAFYSLVENAGNGHAPVIRLLHPQPPVRQLLELTRMHDIFEIVLSDPDSQDCFTEIAQPHLTTSPL